MKAPARGKKTNDTDIDRDHRHAARSRAVSLLPALVALGGGCALVAGPAAALQLGDVRVQSSLGQPLRASIAYALHPGEQVAEHCISLGTGTAANGLTAIGNARIAVGNGAIRLTGRAPVIEPLVAVRLSVACPGTARLTRDYSLLIDPVAPQQTAMPAAERALPDQERVPAGTAPAATPMRTAARPARQPVGNSSYRVQPGDSLSGIAARISGRTMGLWQAVDALFAANPDAFIDGNRDLLPAGAVLVIPDAIVAEAGTGGRVRARAAEAAPSGAEATAAEPVPVAASASREVADSQAAQAPAAVSPSASNAGRSPAARAAPAEDVVSAGADGPFVSPIEVTPVIAPVETAADAPGTRSPVASPATPPDRATATSGNARTWLIGLGGSGIAVILALLLFGRQLKARFGPGAISGAYGRRKTDSGTPDESTIASVSGDLATPEPDATLEDGSELTDSGEIDVLADFGYSASGEFESGSLAPGSGNRDLGATAILEKEILPSDDTGEYDLSMIVDATRQSIEETAETARDLHAVELGEASDDTGPEEAYTISRETDYTILEQDYENELTATQALNKALEKAASDLSLHIDEGEETAHLPSGDPDATAQLPADALDALPAEPGIDPASASTVQMQPEPAADEGRDATASKLGETDVSEGLASDTTYAENDATAEPGDEEAATADKKRLKAS